MRKRTLSLLIAGTFLFGTAAACSDDEGSTETEEEGGSGSESEEGEESGGEGNAEVQAYCDAVTAYVDGGVFDQAAVDELTEAATDLAAVAADLTVEDAEALTDCQAQFAEFVPTP